MTVRIAYTILVFAFALAVVSAPALAAKGSKRSLAEQQAMGLIDTGLVPTYPTNDICLKVSSPFGSRTRYDGSLRVLFSNNGYHGGMDITIDIGEPILAVADGEVIHVATGGRLVGNMIMLRHAPADTGLDQWLFSKYQHLDKPATLSPGDRVKMGEVIGIGGRTGTTGGHYGSAGYPHLHMNIYFNSTGCYKVRRGTKVGIRDMMFADPLALYLGKTLNSQEIRALPDDQKAFDIPYVTTDGRTVPNGTRFVWPIRCRPN